MPNDNGWLIIGSTGRRQDLRADLFSRGGGEYEDGVVVLPRNRSTGRVGPVRQALPLAATWYVAANADRSRLYAAGEPADGGKCIITALSFFEAGEARVINEQPTGGVGACHVALSPGGEHVLVSHFGSGSISVHPLDNDGAVGEASQLLRLGGSGPHVRQDGGHAHQVVTMPGSNHLVGVNLGSDEVGSYTLDKSEGRLTPAQIPAAKVHPGAGPRNLVFSSSGYAYIANELDNTVGVFSYSPPEGTLEYLTHVSSFFDEGFSGPSACGGIALSDDERFLYVSNRGRDSIAVFEVDGPVLSPLQEVAVGGENTHDISMIDSFIYAACTRSNTVTVLPVDSGSGQIGDVCQTISLPVPMSVLAI